MHLEVANPGPR